MVIYLEDYLMRRRTTATPTVVRLGAGSGRAVAAVAAQAYPTPWESTLALLDLDPATTDPVRLYAEATLL